MEFLKRQVSKFKGYLFTAAAKKVLLYGANFITSAGGAAIITAKVQPFLDKYQPVLDKFGIHIAPEAFFLAVGGAIATVIYDAYGVKKQNEEKLDPPK